MTTPLEAAISYAMRGWRVVPIIAGTKRPPMDEWQKSATTDTDLIRTWYGRWPDHGVGIATGNESGIFVLDVDTDETKGKVGADSLADLCATYGSEWTETVTAITGSGGYHLFFAMPANVEIRNKASAVLGRDLDIRGEGGQVVAAPTMHPNGRRYEWQDGYGPGERPVLMAPLWMVMALTTGSARAPRLPARPKLLLSLRPTSPVDRYNAEADFPELLENNGATYLYTRTDHRSVNADGEVATFQAWARPGLEDLHTSASLWPESATLFVFSSAWPALKPERSYDAFSFDLAVNCGGDPDDPVHVKARVKELADAYRRIDGVLLPDTPNLDSLAGLVGGALADARKAAIDAEMAEMSRNPIERAYVDWVALWNGEVAREDWIIQPIIARGRGHAMYAGAKTGKSYVMLAMCAAAATGRAVLGHTAHAPMDILYADWEMTEDDLRSRLEEFGYDERDDLSHLHYSILPTAPPLDTAEGGQALLEAALGVSAALVVIDTISRAVAGPENDADTLRAFYRFTGMRLKAAGVAWIRLDHSGKDPTIGARGSSAKNDDVDVVWRLDRREDNHLVLEATHRRMSWVPERVDLAMVDDDAAGFVKMVTPALDEPTWPTGTVHVAADLDRLGLPLTMSSRKVVEALQADGCSRQRAVVVAAIRFRKWREERHSPMETLLGNPDQYQKNQGRNRSSTDRLESDQIVAPTWVGITSGTALPLSTGEKAGGPPSL